MTSTHTDLRSVIVEREIGHLPEKVWRALTQPHLIAEWLMNSDFAPVVDHNFKFTADWGSVDCTVKTVEPNRELAYSWDAMGLESTVTWTLTPSAGGTLLRMEQAGFRRDQEQAYQGAKVGWRRFFAVLEQTLGKMGQ